MVLDSPHTPEVKEQALCIIGNIAAGAGITDYVMEDERILLKLLDYMVNDYYHKDIRNSYYFFGFLNINVLKLCLYTEPQRREASGGSHVCY